MWTALFGRAEWDRHHGTRGRGVGLVARRALAFPPADWLRSLLQGFQTTTFERFGVGHVRCESNENSTPAQEFRTSLSQGSTFLGTPSKPLTRDSANSLASFLRASAHRLFENRDEHEQAELELTLIDYVARLKCFGKTPTQAGATNVEPLRKADQLVKTLIASGLLRNRNKLRLALCLGLDAALPHWSN
jgi:hypothetical protein